MFEAAEIGALFCPRTADSNEFGFARDRQYASHTLGARTGQGKSMNNELDSPIFGGLLTKAESLANLRAARLGGRSGNVSREANGDRAVKNFHLQVRETFPHRPIMRAHRSTTRKAARLLR
jgi:hypothetical protein